MKSRFKKLTVGAVTLMTVLAGVRYYGPLQEVAPNALTQFSTAVPAAFKKSAAKGFRETIKVPLYVVDYLRATPDKTRQQYNIIVNTATNEAGIIVAGTLDALVPVSTGAVRKPIKEHYGEFVTPEGDYRVKGRRDMEALKEKFSNVTYYGPGQILLIGPFGGDIALHGTDSPQTLGSYETNGCIRFDNRLMVSLLEKVAAGSTVRVRNIPPAAWRDTLNSYRR